MTCNDLSWVRQELIQALHEKHDSSVRAVDIWQGKYSQLKESKNQEAHQETGGG